MECNFVARTVQLNPGVSEDILAIGTIIFRDHGIGFWGWGHDETCYSYDIAGNRPTFDSAYTVANVSASYPIGRYRFDVIASNVFDERYFLARNNAQVNAGEPQQFLFRASARF